jgi:hypothetical protein
MLWNRKFHHRYHKSSDFDDSLRHFIEFSKNNINIILSPASHVPSARFPSRSSTNIVYTNLGVDTRTILKWMCCEDLNWNEFWCETSVFGDRPRRVLIGLQRFGKHCSCHLQGECVEAGCFWSLFWAGSGWPTTIPENRSYILNSSCEILRTRNKWILFRSIQTHFQFLKFGVLTAVKISIVVFWIVTPCGLQVFTNWRDVSIDWGGTSLWNVGNQIQDHTASQPRRPQSISPALYAFMFQIERQMRFNIIYAIFSITLCTSFTFQAYLS